MYIMDLIYGKISISDDHFENVIITKGFQRLKEIVQTSYCKFFPKASYNRMTHSIGVYYLGSLAVKQLYNTSVDKDVKNLLDKYEETFSLACLLHDYGHFPFSHVGEYLIQRQSKIVSFNLIQEIYKLIDSNDFKKDLEEMQKKYGQSYIALHEVVGVIIALHDFKIYFDKKKINLELYVRMILGCCYQNYTKEHQVQNALICLLHGNGMDLDFADCVMRGAYVFGLNVNKWRFWVCEFINEIRIEIKEKSCLSMTARGTEFLFAWYKKYLYEVMNYQKDAKVQYYIGKVQDYFDSLMSSDDCFGDGNDKTEKVYSYAKDILPRMKDTDILDMKLAYSSKESVQHSLWSNYCEYQRDVFLFDRRLVNTLKIFYDKLSDNCSEDGFLLINEEVLHEFIMREDNLECTVFAQSLLSFCDKKNYYLSLKYLPVKGYDISNRLFDSYWNVTENGKSYPLLEFFRRHYDFNYLVCEDFYYLYVNDKNDFSKELWLEYLNYYNTNI